MALATPRTLQQEEEGLCSPVSPSNPSEHSGIINETEPTRAGLLVAILAIVCFAIGPVTGIQGIFDAVASRGVFSNECAAGHTAPCSAQRDRICQTADLALSILNFAGIASGVVLDLAGGYWTAVGGMLLWTLGTALSGLAPADGYAWSIGTAVAGVAGNTAFMALLLHHLRIACPATPAYTFWCAVLTATRMAPAVLVNVPLSYFLQWADLPFWALYLIYGAVIGVPSALVLAVAFKPGPSPAAPPAVTTPGTPVRQIDLQRESLHPVTPCLSLQAAQLFQDFEKSGGTSQDPPSAETSSALWLAPPTESPPPPPRSRCDQLREKATTAKAILLSLDFYFVCAHVACIVTFGYFFIANLGQLMLERTNSKGKADDSQTNSIYIMGGVGLTVLLPGKLIHTMGVPNGFIVVLAMVLVLLVAIGVLCSFGGEAVLYVAFFALFNYRVWATALANQFMARRFEAHKAAIGFAFGVCFTFAGTVSAAVGGYTTQLAETDPSSIHAIIIAFCSGIAVVDVAFLARIFIVGNKPWVSPQRDLPIK
jgi:hypothetical protein